MPVNVQFISASRLALRVSLLIVLSVLFLHSQSMQSPKKLLLSHILIKVSLDAEQGQPGEISLARKRAEEVLTAARSGTSFAHLAEQYSDDAATAEVGGSLGWVRRGQLAPALEEAAFQLKVGEISGIVQSAFGFHILRLVAIADDHESAFPATPRFRKLPVTPPETSVEPSPSPASRWPDPNDPRQTGVGKTISELRELCNQHSDLPFGTKSNSKAQTYECVLASIQMDDDYETLVDRISALQRQLCRLYNGSLPERAPTAPELAETWKEAQLLAEEWQKRAGALLKDAEATEAKDRQNVDAQNKKLAAQQRAQRLVMDYWRVYSNCGHGL